MDLFLPFTHEGKRVEKQAIEVKRLLHLGPYTPIDPFDVLPAVPARLIAVEDLPPGIQQTLTNKRSRTEWSAIGYGPSPVDGEELIMLNPTHHEHRQRASLMEEIVHILLHHPKVVLRFDGERSWKRPFSQKTEDEAFNIGAACIIPYRPLFNMVNNQSLSARAIATRYSVSEEYAVFRIKRAGLYNVYRKRLRTTRKRHRAQAGN